MMMIINGDDNNNDGRLYSNFSKDTDDNKDGNDESLS